MRMTFGEAVRLVFNQLGLNVLWIQLGIWIGLVLVTMMGFGSIVLSAWGFEWVTTVFLVFYLIFVLGVIYSPITWGGISATAVVAGQPGGEENLSLNDGLNVLKRWAPIALDKMGLILIFWVPVWLLYTILFSTDGYVKENMLLFILIPTLIYFAKDEWPTGKLVIRIAGYTLVIVAVYVVGMTVLGTVQKATTDPEVRQVQTYLDSLEVKEKKKIEKVVETIIAKKNAGKPISGLEQGILDELERRAKAQSLKPADIKAKAEKFVESARPTDASWWKENWLWLAGGALALFIATRIWRAATRPTAVNAVGAVVTSAGHGTTQSTGKWTWALITLAVVGWCWYSIDREVGFPGTWLAKKNYVETFDITVVDFRDQPPICAPQINLPEGQKIKFGFLNPDRDNNLGEVKAEVEGAPTINLASIMRLNRTTRHLAFRPVGKCLIVDWTGIPPEYKDLRLKRGLTVTVLLQAAN